MLSTAPAAVPDASGRRVWRFTLDSGATKNLDIGLRLPAVSGSYAASLIVDSIRNDVISRYTNLDSTLNVESAETIFPRLVPACAAAQSDVRVR